MPFKILRAAPLLHKRRALAKLRHERRHPIAIRLELPRGGINVRIEDVHQVRDSWFAIRVAAELGVGGVSGSGIAEIIGLPDEYLARKFGSAYL